MKVLFVSSSQGLSQLILSVLKIRWPELRLVQADEVRDSLELIHDEQPDLVMFHIPDRRERASPASYFDIITQIHGFSAVPLMVISQGDDVMDKVKALEMGADDWVSPSCSPMEFIAKVNAILRRRSPNGQGVFSLFNNKLSIDYAARQVRISGKPVRLTPIEYKLLCHLAENRGRVCSSAELLQHVWGPNYSDDRELLKLNVYRLRSKIEQDPSNPEIIFNERGVGYVIRAAGSSER